MLLSDGNKCYGGSKPFMAERNSVLWYLFGPGHPGDLSQEW